MNDKSERLTAGLDPAQREALGDLEELAEVLASDGGTPDPSPTDHARLLAALEPYLPPLTPAPANGSKSERPLSTIVSRAGSAMWAQAALLRAPFWWAGALVLLLGLGAALLKGSGLLPLLFVFLTPVLAAAGVAYAFRPETRTLWELERLTPVRPLELLYTRLLVVLAFDALLSLVLLAMVWVQVPQLVLWRFLLVWLGPMLALAGIALYATVRWGPTSGAVLPLGLWGAFVTLAWWQVMERATDVQTAVNWVLAQLNTSAVLPVTCLLAAMLGLLMLWQAGQSVENSAWT
ncbi:MAG: hypothetical protein ACOC7N_02725 [Chloroflexota bacterium]